ncbi:MAG: hypothetical protein C0504_05195 [Candidatus Solibacter sp.]|nr:hypothetical protein [Candidatus Solibacter sp.]
MPINPNGECESNPQPAGKLYWLAAVLVLLSLLAPVAAVDRPPLVDYPNHLARLHILQNLSHAPLFQQRYEAVLEPYPNLAMDLLLMTVLRGFDIHAAGALAVALAVALFAAGCLLLGRSAQGRRHWPALLACFMVYNSQFLYGFINYTFGIALYLLALAVWFWHRDRRTPGSYALLYALATAAYLAHLIGFAALGLSLVCLAVMERLQRRVPLAALAGDMAALIPGLLLYASLGSNRGATALTWASAAEKLKHSLSWLISYHTAPTAAYGLLLLAAGILLAWKGRSTVNPLLAAVSGVLWAGVALLPDNVGMGTDLYARLVIPAVSVTLISVRIESRRGPALAAIALALGVFLARQAEIGFTWRAGQHLMREQLALLAELPAGAKLYPISWFTGDAAQAKREQHLSHLPHYATIGKQVYVPTLLAVRGQQPIALRNPPWYRSVRPGTAAAAAPWQSILGNYGFVWTFGVTADYDALLGARCELIGARGKGRLYRVRSPQPGG